MFEVIVAMTKNGGIGLNGSLAWKCKEELQLFKEKTMGNVIVMGRKTVETLPFLKNREIWCLTKNKNLDTSSYKNNVKVFTDIDCLLNTHTEKTVFIAGGSEIYRIINPNTISKWHVSIMNDDYNCDAFYNVSFSPDTFTIINRQVRPQFTHYVYERRQTMERRYISLIKAVTENGTVRNGRNGETKSLFGTTLHFDLRDGFPLLTTKKMFWRGIVEELLFFLKGYTDSKILEEKGIMIWQGNTNRQFLDKLGMADKDEGVMGPMYGWQWRNFGGEYDSSGSYQHRKNNPTQLKRVKTPGFDQLNGVINLIKTDPHSRRILMTDYNPVQAGEGVLYPCHSIILQFYVDGNNLDMSCYNRSQDLFHGVPFNIASSALLLHIIAQTTSKTARHFYLNMGDTHIYSQHYSAVEEQLTRIPFVLPTILINKELRTITDIEHLGFTDFVLQDYNCHPSIKADMVA